MKNANKAANKRHINFFRFFMEFINPYRKYK